MNIIDTDALSHHLKRNAIGQAIEAHIAASRADFAITAVSVFEMVDGAVELYERRKRQRRDLIPGFGFVQEVVEYLCGWCGRILPFDANADQIYRAFGPRLRQELRGDARVAAIALARGASVWTCNVRDFTKVPSLVVVQAETGAASH